MITKDHEWKKVTKTDFREKLTFGIFWAKRAQNGQKLKKNRRNHPKSQKIRKNRKNKNKNKKMNFFLERSAKTACLGKIWFSRFLAKKSLKMAKTAQNRGFSTFLRNRIGRFG